MGLTGFNLRRRQTALKASILKNVTSQKEVEKNTVVKSVEKNGKSEKSFVKESSSGETDKDLF